MRILLKIGGIVFKLNENFIKTKKHKIIMVYNPVLNEYVPFTSVKHLVQIQY